MLRGTLGGARADKLLYQAKLALSDSTRLKIIRKMYAVRFGEEPPTKRSIEQLRGFEGVRVKEMYKILSIKYGVIWRHRKYDYQKWENGDVPNRCLSAATSCLYGITEAAILASGYSPAISFIHTGKPQSFVYDIADIFKFQTVVPVAFEIAGKMVSDTSINIERMVRIKCRDIFRKTGLLEVIIPTIEKILSAGGISIPIIDEVVPIAIPNKESIGDGGHRS